MLWQPINSRNFGPGKNSCNETAFAPKNFLLIFIIQTFTIVIIL